MPVTDEHMFEIASVVSNIYNKTVSCIGDTSTPGSMVYELENISRYANGDLPLYGLKEGFVATIAGDTITLSEGQVIYNGTSYTIEEKTIRVNKIFQSDFPEDYQYGFVIYFKIEDVSQINNSIFTKLTNSLTRNSSRYIEIEDISTVKDTFSLPFKVNIEGEEIPIWDIQNDMLVVSPHYNNGYVAANHAANSKVYVFKELEPSIVYGLPVGPEYQSNDDPTTFSYYPPVPVSENILICRGIAQNPRTINNPDRTVSIIGIEDLREFAILPSESLTEVEKVNIQSTINSLQNSLLTYNYDTIKSIVSSIVVWSEEETGYNFADYWNNRPFVKMSNYIRGEAFEGITRFEFPDGFKELYYEIYGQDLLTTFAIFRGDILGNLVPAGSPPNQVTATYSSGTDASYGTISFGTWIYYVTAVTSNGESSPSNIVTVNIPQSAGIYNRIELSWEAVQGALYYNVYRVMSNGVIPVDYKLTSENEVTTNSYIDVGIESSTMINRAIKLTGKTIFTPSQLVVCVPYIDENINIFRSGGSLNQSYTDVDNTTANEVNLYIYGLKEDGSIGGPHVVNVPKGTSRGQKFYVGTTEDKYIGVYNVYVEAGTDLNILGGRVQWSPYDLITVQNV